MRKSIWIRGACIAAAIFMAAVLLFGAKGIGKVNNVPTPAHKVEHFLYYGAMAALIAHGVGRRRLWIALLVVPLVGILDEWHQLYVPRRNGSALDWMVDMAGILTAVYLYHRWMATEEKIREERGKRQAVPEKGQDELPVGNASRQELH